VVTVIVLGPAALGPTMTALCQAGLKLRPPRLRKTACCAFVLLNLIMEGINSPLFIFHAAKEYFENGTSYASKYFKKSGSELVVPFDSLTHAKLCVPATNITFALELTFKGILKLSATISKGHNLEKLYKSIAADIRDKIFDHYQSHNVYGKYITIRIANGLGHGTTQAIILN